MPRRKNRHTGRTDAGHTRDVKVERIGKVTIYQRGEVYYLYYRQGGVTQRQRIDGSLAVARATAHKVQNALDEGRSSPIAYAHTSPDKMVEGYLDAVAHVQKLTLRTQDRYRAALDRFNDFCFDAHIGAIDTFDLATVENFVKWLRGQKRTRNGAAKGKRDSYKPGGIKFILSTCRTAFNWAARHRMLPPFVQNPFILFQIDKLKDPAGNDDGEKIFTPEQEKAFFAACNSWHKPIFTTLASYGLRLGELTHLLIEDVDFVNNIFVIRSKPWLFWTVKTGRERRLPLLPATKAIFESAIGGRKAGFVFLNAKFVAGRSQPSCTFTSSQPFKAHFERVLADLLAMKPDANERQQKRAVVVFSRSLGQIPEKRLRCEFLALTAKIGCPEFTRAHDLRHLFSSRAQAAGVNPILVQEMLGHTTLEMTRRYTHLGMDSKREALQRLAALPDADDGKHIT
jgi:integrase